MKKIIFVTTNPGKIKEVEHVLKDFSITAISPREIPNAPKNIRETGTTFEENACIKAKAFGKSSGLITLADDSGLEVDALDGRPGIYSSRYAPSDAQRIKKLLKEMNNFPKGKRTARFVSVICIYNPQTKTTQTVKGTVAGRITKNPRGNQGFGYDPVFFCPEIGNTFGENFNGKQQVSHRYRALQKVRKILFKL